jgi:hypothetical protein
LATGSQTHADRIQSDLPLRRIGDAEFEPAYAMLDQIIGLGI